MIDLCFIIPAYNEEKNIKNCLESIIKERGYTYQIIVIDDGSTDNTFKIARKFDCKLI